MQLAILHHHLNRGGVAQVIANHLQALATLPRDQQPSQATILFDGQREAWATDQPGGDAGFAVDLAVAAEIGYDLPHAPAEPAPLADVIEAALTTRGFQRELAVLHVHNHSLGKNASLPGALAELARRGWRLLLQIHDFAEDNRPANYRRLRSALGVEDPDALAGILYPQAPSIRYAALTQRDAAVLRRAGVPGERVEHLPNPAAEFGALPAAPDARRRVFRQLALPADARLIVYPVRGIRRKNIGEILLLAALSPADAQFAVTLAPLNPAELASFAAWREIAVRLQLRCLFDTGGRYGVPYRDALAAADALATTSVAEGFGMVFLEAWLAGRMLVGRDLPEITREFCSEGLRFSGFYDRLAVPLTLLDGDGLRDDLCATYATVCREYGVSAMSPAAVDAAIDGMIVDGTIDFAHLAPPRQALLVERAASDAAAAEGLRAANPAVATLLNIRGGDDAGLVDANAAVVRRRYSTTVLGRRLVAAYRRLLAAPEASSVSPLVGGRAVLDHFVTPQRVQPVRVAPWPND